MKVIAILGAGPGLGLSMARRFAREGFAVALVSRTTERHADYLASLDGAEAQSYAADLTSPEQLRAVLDRITADLGDLDTVYFGPAAVVDAPISPITELDPVAVRDLVGDVLTAPITLVSAVLPGMRARGRGTLLFAGGLSGKHPLPQLGTLVPASAALRMYVLTLAAALEEEGLYAATLTIGGLIERGDIHRKFSAEQEFPTLNPDDIADTAWRMYVERTEHEHEFNALF
ncbi:SDR family NAD(P)-dependent oxidoreductase [Amycolatopsis sp. CA-230715]|uniref:SDR family NAD(P)-dependent oxidoreductase n=1 Tax=Amycolatopsis sp. CA-230715 TaxID=2745196 RepID=UPI001C0388A3|nr:SDR family NAD(P)-dependent oxidoreductase [Amycolatopsis sp. CA-230715]QWF78244.1 hypothetical protein HUW46_01639 [Amycolatopsis sp. CA-230715]